jgi:hypothetical protein
VTPAGAPLVAPTDGSFFRGMVWFGLTPRAVRARLVRRDRRVSASYSRESFAFIVHGSALDVGDTDPASAEYEALVRELYVATCGPGWIEWYEQLRNSRDGWGSRATSNRGSCSVSADDLHLKCLRPKSDRKIS